MLKFIYVMIVFISLFLRVIYVNAQGFAIHCGEDEDCQPYHPEHNLCSLPHLTVKCVEALRAADGFDRTMGCDIPP
ncbi:unnamed protein product [Trifolium pratense]|uniref:Uncharacterized protein n=1 Tax=Trifolium pratense TaxID=57577 RepID=A0ACB0KQK3_TRIPR|nr:unnamed protein product [Trifolium pratense]